jgi:hypothetical protein
MGLRTAVVLSGVWVFAAACSPTAPSSPASVAGLWTGSTDPPSRAIAHYIFFRIDQSGTSLSGTYGTTAGSGTLAGEVNGSIVSLTATHLSPRNQRCPGTFSVKAKVMLNRMGGTMTLPSDCTGRTNNIALEREPAKLACAWAVVCYATQTRMDLARSSVLHVLTPSPERPLPNAELVLRRESQPHSEGAVRDGGIARLGSVKKIRLDGYARETDRACAILVTGP